jgi:MtN3 and saliva related transmembrane protein
MIKVLGLIAGASTTLAFLPQVIKTWRTRSTSDISLAMFLVLVSGAALWLIYGLAKGDFPLVAAKMVAVALQGTTLWFKLRFG